MSPDRFTPYTARLWRAPDRVSERCRRMRELDAVGLNQMEIALVIFREFGNPETGKPIDHTTVWHHVKGKCTHP